MLAAILFIKRSSETTQILAVDESTETEGSHHSLAGKVVPPGVMVYRMMGAFFFGAVDKLESVLNREKQEPEVLILRMRKVGGREVLSLFDEQNGTVTLPRQWTDQALPSTYATVLGQPPVLQVDCLFKLQELIQVIRKRFDDAK